MAQIGPQLKEKQVQEVLECFPGLCFDADAGGEYAVIYGDLCFRAQHGSLEAIEDTFSIEIVIPNNYPSKLPITRETQGRVRSDFEHIYVDGHFCLAAEMAELMAFNKTPTLRGYVENLVIPFLYVIRH